MTAPPRLYLIDHGFGPLDIGTTPTPGAVVYAPQDQKPLTLRVLEHACLLAAKNCTDGRFDRLVDAALAHGRYLKALEK